MALFLPSRLREGPGVGLSDDGQRKGPSKPCLLGPAPCGALSWTGLGERREARPENSFSAYAAVFTFSTATLTRFEIGAKASL